MGSKARLAKHILPIILKDRLIDQWYVEPFVGGFNMMDKVCGNRIANDSNNYLISLFKKVIEGWIPYKINRQDWRKIKQNPSLFEDHIVGWAGTGCSYCGVWLGGYSGETITKNGIRDYQAESIRAILSQAIKIKDVLLFSSSYEDLLIPDKSIIYCDPPYANVSGYKDKFDSNAFYNYCRRMRELGHSIFISEYSMPSDFTCVWKMNINSSLSKKMGGNDNPVEKLFTIL